MRFKIMRPKGLTEQENQHFDHMIRDRIWHSVTGRRTMPIDVTDLDDGRFKELHLFSDKKMTISSEGGDIRAMNLEARYTIMESGYPSDVKLAKSFHGTINLKDDIFNVSWHIPGHR